MHEVKRSGQFVTPGEKLGVIEEFISSTGTYVKDGSIFSRVVGRVLMDLMNKKVSVYPLARGACVPRVGNIVTGNVRSVQDSISILRIFKIGTRRLSGFFSGVIHISDCSFRYVDSMFDVCRMGDIARAKVISEKNGAYHLTLKGENLGVLYAFCSSCGHILTRKRARMVCENCGSIERRKTAMDYGRGTI
ncbi:MAG: exosome complex RNA-binding protein Csl4 [Candidatus Bathyarchaeia archaeon]